MAQSKKHAAEEISTWDVLASVFEERAENLSRQELEAWSAQSPRDSAILSKLKGPGSKLLTGPRGSGKSTLLRKAYFELLEDREVLPAYVNYARALALEPMFHTHANALQLFRQWIIFKVIDGIHSSVLEMQQSAPPEMLELANYGQLLIRSLEVGDPPAILDKAVSPSELLVLLESWTEQLGCRRCVLLLDDAAHAFSQEQQQQFFEIFRELRSRRVSGKAAVYPGTTSYSPFFHVGHEAEVLEAWYHPDDDSFLPIMRSIVERRLTPSLLSRLEGRQEIIDYLALASFGLPRGFLNMLSQFLGVEEGTPVQPNRSRAVGAVADHAESVRGIFLALSSKLPRFKHFVEVGKELEGSVIRRLRSYNKGRDVKQKAVVVAIEEPIRTELDRILNFLEYAGLVRKMSSVSRGVKGRFQRYTLHYAIVLAENVLSLGKSYTLAAAVEALRSRSAHAFVRGRGETFLGAKFAERCKLDLPPCGSCGAPRVSPEQRYCMRCGAELTNVSIYEELLKAPIDELPLTKSRIARIKAHTDLRTMQDVILDDELQTIRTVPYIGPIWASRIRNYAQEFVSV